MLPSYKICFSQINSDKAQEFINIRTDGINSYVPITKSNLFVILDTIGCNVTLVSILCSAYSVADRV